MHNKGLHHITVLAGDPQENARFYVHTLGLRLALKSVNQDEPGTYHLFYTNGGGEPGSSLTFFPFPAAARGKKGSGETTAVSFAVPENSKDYWASHLAKSGIAFEGPFEFSGLEWIRFEDPDGLSLELVFDPAVNDLPSHNEGTIPKEYGIRGFWGTTLKLSTEKGTIEVLKDILGFEKSSSGNDYSLYKTGSTIGHTVIIEKTDKPFSGRPGKGTVHHVAFRVKDDMELEEKRLLVARAGLNPTPVIDRFVFKSVYFRSPGGVLFEMATDGPGYNSAQGKEDLGNKLFLPPWLEQHREKIEKQLPEINI